MRLAAFIFVPSAAIGLVVFFVFQLKPPAVVRFAAGQEAGGYWQIAERYKSRLAQDGIQVELIETNGSVNNIGLLAAGDADVAFVQGGLDIPEDHGLRSLGAVFLEAMIAFHHISRPLEANPGRWERIRLATGPEGSGSRSAAQNLIEVAGLQSAGIELLPFAGSDAIAALRAGDADALVFVAPMGAPYLVEATHDPEIVFVRMQLIEALALNLRDARAVTIPAGAISFDPPRPAQSVDILTLKASLIGASDLHPALTDRLVQAAMFIHGDRDFLHGYREFPNAESPPAPIDDIAWELMTSGPNFLHSLFPYWIAAQMGRVLLLVLPLLFLAPVVGAIPGFYAWFQRRRVWRHYQRIVKLNTDLDFAAKPEDIDEIVRELAEVDMSLANLKLPLAFRQDAYDARLHIDLLRNEVLRRHDYR